MKMVWLSKDEVTDKMVEYLEEAVHAPIDAVERINPRWRLSEDVGRDRRENRKTWHDLMDLVRDEDSVICGKVPPVAMEALPPGITLYSPAYGREGGWKVFTRWAALEIPKEQTT